MRLTSLIRDFLFSLYVIYFAQGSLYPSGSIISKTCIGTIIFISGIYFIKTLLIKNKRDLFYNSWTLFILLNIIGFIFNPELSDWQNRNMIKHILGCMLSFYPFYYFAKNGELKAKHLVLLLVAMIPVLILAFFTQERNILMARDTENTNVVNNVAYSFVNLLPYVFLIKNKKMISGALMILILSFIINGAKRGAIIAGLIGTLLYFYYLIRTIEKRNLIFGYFAVIIIILGLGVYVFRTSLTNQYMVNRMASMIEGNTSGRNEIYETLFFNWYHSDNIINLIFGFGFGSSLDIAGIKAHSDWLELLTSFGLIGILLYLFIFYAAARNIWTRNWMADKRILLLCVVMIWFFVSMISMMYNSFDGFLFAILFAYLLGNKEEAIE